MKQHLEESRIVVERNKVKFFIQATEIDGVERQADIVRCHKVAGAQLAKDRQLIVDERRVGIRLITIVIESQSGIWVSARWQRHWNLRKIRVGLTPKHGSPGLVQLF